MKTKTTIQRKNNRVKYCKTEACTCTQTQAQAKQINDETYLFSLHYNITPNGF